MRKHLIKVQTDLSKAFDCIAHDFLTTMFSTYGFTFPALKLIYNYLFNRKHHTRKKSSYNDIVMY